MLLGWGVLAARAAAHAWRRRLRGRALSADGPRLRIVVGMAALALCGLGGGIVLPVG